MGRNVTAWEWFGRLSDDEFADGLDIVLSNLRSLLVAKRQSYGPTNLVKFGDAGVLVRTSDKLERLVHMQRKGLGVTAVGEDALDAWMDIAGYALLSLTAHSLGEEPDAVVHDGPTAYPPELDVSIHTMRGS